MWGVHLSFISGVTGAKFAVAIVVTGVLSVGSVGAAAFSANLPAPLQQAAHELIGAPAPTEGEFDDIAPSASPSPEPTVTGGPVDSAGGPDATGRSAFGLCNAFAHGGLNETSMAYAALSAAAATSAADEAAIALVDGGEASDDGAGGPSDLSGIEAYCAKVPSPGKSGEHGEKSDKATKPDKAEKAEKPAKPAKSVKDKTKGVEKSKPAKAATSPGKGKGAGKSGGR